MRAGRWWMTFAAPALDRVSAVTEATLPPNATSRYRDRSCAAAEWENTTTAAQTDTARRERGDSMAMGAAYPGDRPAAIQNGTQAGPPSIAFLRPDRGVAT